MNQDWLVLRLRSWVLLLGLFSQMIACQQNGPLQGPVRPADKKTDPSDKQTEDDAEAERVSPPSNIIGSYLACIEKEELGNNIQQNATLQCGVYREPGHTNMQVTLLNQWQLTGSTAVLRAVSPGSASLVEVQFQASDLISLKQSIRKARLTVKVDSGDSFGGVVSDLVPADSRLATVNANKTASLVPLWNEGFEGTQFPDFDSYLYHELKEFVMTTVIDWVNPTTQIPSCGLPLFEAMRFATLEGGVDNIGAAEGQQFVDTDSACWPEDAIDPIRGASNLAIRKELVLNAGRVYRVSFKVRQQPLPGGVGPFLQGLQVKINGQVVRDLRAFTNAWQDVSFEFVAASGLTKIEWVDVGAADDSVGVLLDDLRVQVENF
ncbi:hypothetical protein [Oligoflexus tunisiensis]|uniref:hypothetical protein n=1 Tax=Oligoflexus tunisiensis TaxID=708132 RepID=UPI00114D3AA5|nr:hypothetical protein [Oligoflexus tunisiensis]